MMHDQTLLAATGLERRSGLAGLGGRPKRHPAWDEGAPTVDAGFSVSSANSSSGADLQSERLKVMPKR
jgi:hypothetical protein